MGNQLSHQELADVLHVAVRVGVLMLQSGASSFRADQVISRIALALGIDRIEAYVTPTVIVATVHSGSEHRTQISKPAGLGVNMSRITALDHLSRNTPSASTPALISELVDEIERQPAAYSRSLVIAAVGLACGAFAVILGGGPAEFAAAGVGSAFAQALRLRMAAARFNPIPLTVICAAIATGISLLLVRALVAPLPRLGVIASVLLLVPGVPLVTALLDMTRFDLVSGLSRGLHAVLLLLSIGLGMLLILAWTSFEVL